MGHDTRATGETAKPTAKECVGTKAVRSATRESGSEARDGAKGSSLGGMEAASQASGWTTSLWEREFTIAPSRAQSADLNGAASSPVARRA